MADRTGNEPDQSRVETLLLECLERVETEGEAVVDEYCSRHPELADEFRRRIKKLRDAGLLGEGGVLQQTTRSTLQVPEQLGEFRLLEMLGGGGMGVVYLAEQEGLERKVALKLIRPEQLYFPGARERFRREVQIIGRLQHPGIVPILTVGEDGEVPYFAMERIHGCTLEAVLERLSGRDPRQLAGADLARVIAEAVGTSDREEEEAGSTFVFNGSYEDACLHLIRQVAEALEHAHRKGVIHRDIKPSNIMVTPSGRAMLMDFGLSSAEGSNRLTRSGSQMGSLNYMSPEQTRGGVESLDHRTDVYSLGVTLHELLTLKPAFQGDSMPSILSDIEAGRIRSPRSLNPNLSWETETVVLTAMETNPVRRYQHAADLARDLGNVTDHHPIEARRAGVVRRARLWIRRNPALGVGLLLGMVLLVGVPTGYAIMQRDARQRILEKSQLAERNFQRALEAVDRMLTRVGDQHLRFVPQMEPVRKKLLQDAVEFYESLLADRSDDPDVRKNVALARGRAGRLLVNLGETERAREMLSLSLEEFQVVIDESADPDPLRYEMCAILLELGVASQRMQKKEEAGRVFARADAILRDLLQEDPEDSDLLIAQAATLGAQAVHHLEAGDLVRAGAFYQQAVDHLEDVFLREPDSPGLRAKLGQFHAEYGWMLHRGVDVDSLGPMPKAEKHLARAVEVLAELADEQPENAEYLNLLCRARNNLASFWRKQDRAGEAESLYQEILEVLEVLSERFPATYDFRWQLATAHNNLAIVGEMTGRREMAVTEYGRSLEILWELVGRMPEQAELRANLGSGERNLSLLLLRDNDLEGALEHIELAIDQARVAAEMNPENPFYTTNLADDHLTLANVHAALGQSDECVAAMSDFIDFFPDRWLTYTAAASNLSACVQLVRSGDGRDSVEAKAAIAEYASFGVECIRSALSLGFDAIDELETEPSLQSLRATEEFRALLDELDQADD